MEFALRCALQRGIRILAIVKVDSMRVVMYELSACCETIADAFAMRSCKHSHNKSLDMIAEIWCTHTKKNKRNYTIDLYCFTCGACA